MLLYNQKNACVTWTGAGKEYAWEPYGSCEVPENLFPHIQRQGFPVDTVPVPPKVKAKVAVDTEQAAHDAAEITQLRAKLEQAESVAAEARKACEAASDRANASDSKAAELLSRLNTLQAQFDAAKSEIAEYEKLLTESDAKNAAAEKAKAKADAEEKAKTEKTKGK